ncbi:hypothetical protein ACQP2P_01245 [Dactylosporangium sp. CA-139114]|uniref:hypothetical protein n=1 Tax=Dactylosporangium sp. CA-139114 TaxID=3239931 RepID=UPI003D96AF8F
MIPNARVLLALLPVLTLAFAAVALRPRAGSDRALTIIRAAIAVAAGAVLTAELFSLVHWISPVPFGLAWLAAALVTGGLAWRSLPDKARKITKNPAQWWPRRSCAGATVRTVQKDGENGPEGGAERGRWLVAGLRVAVGLLVASELVLALASSPNNFDSNSYHLAKIEHWVADGSLGNFATVQTQQIILVPGAELLLLHLRLLTGLDGQYNLLQWAAGLLGALAVARCARQLGAGRAGRWLSAAVYLTAPAVALESTSTQNDLVVTAWVACAATLALDARRTLAPRRALASGPRQAAVALDPREAAVALDPREAAAASGPREAADAPHTPASEPLETGPTPAADAREIPAATGAVADRAPVDWPNVLGLAGAAGLVMVTKSTGAMALLAVLAYWGVCRLRRKSFKQVSYGLCSVILATAALAGPSLLRVHDAFGSPFGPPGYRDALSNTRHDPPAILVNGLRLGASTLLTPVAGINEAIGGSVVRVAGAVGVDPNDPGITQWRSTFPGERWKPDEDRSPYPVQSALVLLGTVAGLCWRRTRGYALLVLGALVATAAIVKWQDWGNRLILPAFAVAAPLAGYALERAFRIERAALRRMLGALAVLTMLTGAAHGLVAVYYGQPRRLVGHGSVFTLDDWQERFARMPDQAASYRTAIDQVRASGAKRVGLVLEGDLWEYPLQIELRDKELVELESEVPGHPAGDVTSVDAVICVSSAERCHRIVPANWQYNRIDQYVVTVFPNR